MAKAVHGLDHVSRDGMVAAVTRVWHAPGFATAAAQYCGKCMVRMKVNVGKGIPTDPAVTPSPQSLFDHLQMDFIELTPCRGYKYCLVLDRGKREVMDANAVELLSQAVTAELNVSDCWILLGIPHCVLEILRLSGCRITEEGCSSLASALRSKPSHLRELDLSYNHPGDSGVKLLSAVLEGRSCKMEKLNVDHSGECRTRPGLQRYSCQLTLDPNTAHRGLSLSEGNRKVTRGAEQPYPDHPERFETEAQVLCRESLTGRCYWEAEWDGDRAEIGVTYKGIRRKGWSADGLLEANDKSWSLRGGPRSYSVWYKNEQTPIPIRPSSSRRVGVYLDWGAGALSFYRVSSDGLTLLHRFTSSFTEPLCLGFRVSRDIFTVSQCDMLPLLHGKYLLFNLYNPFFSEV
ncbi:uncharacterized protein [Paramormyrops kingsleyae]|uniref:uncharacterized protein n=1 Tax=Paramormyrops kingsleyae TaxID=1676925 RepID=UPI003B97A97C